MTRLVPDARLARRAAKGDERAFATIYRRYHQDLYRFCFSIVGNAEDAQDALQNTMVKALRALPGDKREVQLKPWLYRVAHNESIELLRKRRDQVEFDPELAASGGELAETAALRERLRGLLADLGDLPQRQRAALVMRELAGLGFAQIGEAFDTSAAVARQTIYEARLSLRELEAGREMSCEQVTQQLSDADGRVTRRRDIQAHLRSCADCRAFRDAIDARRRDLTALAPLPVAAAGSILGGLLGGHAGASGGGLAGAAGAGAGKVIATSAMAKTAATVAAVAAIGVTAADRGGLIDARLPGRDGSGAKPREAPPTQAAPARTIDRSALRRATARDGTSQNAILPAVRAQRALEDRDPSGRKPGVASAPRGEGKSGKGPPASLPDASQHGQQTAAAHKGGGSHPAKGKGRAAAAPGHQGQKGGGRSPAKPSKPHGASGPATKGGAGSKSGKDKAPVDSGAKPEAGSPTSRAPAEAPAPTAPDGKGGQPTESSP